MLWFVFAVKFIHLYELIHLYICMYTNVYMYIYIYTHRHIHVDTNSFLKVSEYRVNTSFLVFKNIFHIPLESDHVDKGHVTEGHLVNFLPQREDLTWLLFCAGLLLENKQRCSCGEDKSGT